jgi:glutamine synthetase adenylyltransferase
MNTTARHDLPSDTQQLAKLAFLLNYDHADELVEELKETRGEIRIGFESVLNVGL